MGSDAQSWQRLVEPHFGFLVEHGFQITATDDSSSWQSSVTYTSAVAGVMVARSQEFNRSEVHLIRLVEGAVPPYPVFITADRIDWTLLDTVLELRNPELYAKSSAMTGLSDNEIDQQLAFWAESIRTVCSDFLKDDLSAIDEAAVLIRERAG